MAQCSFCGTELKKGTGLMFVKKDAKVLYFCSRKCEKNMLVLKRKARNMPWTAEAAREKQMMKNAEAAHAKEIKQTKQASTKKESKPATKKVAAKK